MRLYYSRCLPIGLFSVVFVVATIAAAEQSHPPRKGVIEGTVANSAGEPIAGAQVGLALEAATVDRRGPMVRSRSDRDGRFRFDNVDPGAYTIHVRVDGGRAVTPAVLEPGGHIDLPIPLQASAANRPPRQAGEATDRPAREGHGGQSTTPAARGERHATQLRVGDEAVDFILPTPHGKEQIELSSFRGKQPVVLIFGSYSCPPFRDRFPRIEELAQLYKGQAQFLMVYIREAHPDSVVYVEQAGVRVLQMIQQTSDLASRSRNAQVCVESLKVSFPAVVDKEDNKVNAAYAGWPSRIVVVDQQGKIAFDGGPGPAGFQPAPLGQWLKANVRLAEDQPPAEAP